MKKCSRKWCEVYCYAIAPLFSWRPDDKNRFHFSRKQLPIRCGLRLAAAKVPLCLNYDANGKAHNCRPTSAKAMKTIRSPVVKKKWWVTASHEFNDTFTVRQNPRYTQNQTLYRSVYGNGYIAPAQISRGTRRSDEDLNSFTVDNNSPVENSRPAPLTINSADRCGLPSYAQ